MENDEHSIVAAHFGGPGYAPAEEVEAQEEAQQLEEIRAKPVTVGDIIDAPEEPEEYEDPYEYAWLEDEPDPLAQVDERLGYLEEAVQSRDAYHAERAEAEQASETEATNEWVDSEVQQISSQLPRNSIVNPAGVLEEAYRGYQAEVQQALDQGYTQEEIDSVSEKAWSEWKQNVLTEANNAAITHKIFNGPGWGKR